MQNRKSLFIFLALSISVVCTYAQSVVVPSQTSMRSVIPTDTSEYLSTNLGLKSLGLGVGVGYVHNGEKNFCVALSFNFPLSKAKNGHQYVAGLGAHANYDMYSNSSAYSFDDVTVGFSPRVLRVSRFSDRVDFFAGAEFPLSAGRSSAKYAGTIESEDRIYNYGVLVIIGAAFQLTESSSISLQSGLAGYNASRRSPLETPEIYTSTSRGWLGLNKNNTLVFSYNLTVGAGKNYN